MVRGWPIRLMSLMLAALLLAGCDAVTSMSSRLVSMAASEEQEARVEVVHDAMLARDTDALRELAHPLILNGNFDTGIAQMYAAMPEGEPLERLIVSLNWRTMTNSGGTNRQEDFVHIFRYETGDMTVRTAFAASGDEPMRVTTLYVNYVADADRPDSAWTPGQWIAAILAPAVALFCLVSLIAVFRVRRLKRRILWFIFILVIGFPVFTFFSHTGQWALTAPGLVSTGNGFTVNFFQVQLFSASWLSFPAEHRWTVNVAIPVGALLFWLQFLRGKLARKPEKSAVEENHAEAPNLSQPADRAPDWPPDRRR